MWEGLRQKTISRYCPFKEFWTKAKGPFLHWLVRRALPAGTRDFCPALTALVGLAQSVVFLTVHYFSSFVPIAQQARQAVMLGRRSLSMCQSVPTHSVFSPVPYLFTCGCDLMRMKLR
jgi:hypothetical protein